jgi:hypothetical protein
VVVGVVSGWGGLFSENICPQYFFVVVVGVVSGWGGFYFLRISALNTPYSLLKTDYWFVVEVVR